MLKSKMTFVRGMVVSLRMVPTNTEVFLRSLWLCGKSTSKPGLLKSKKKIGGNHAFFGDN